jgi:tetratricopeptide (TPR) repeat protein
VPTTARVATPTPNRSTSERWRVARKRSLGPDHPEITTSLNNPAALYEYQGRYADAEPPYKRALTIREKVLGPDHPWVALSLNNPANLYDSKGRYADAGPLYKRSLAIRESARS